MKFFTKTPPWPHQQDALEFGYNKPAVGYFMDMGTGKTKVAIDEIVNMGFQLTLILCPLSVVDVWPLEFEKHSPIEFQLFYPAEGESNDSFIKRLEDADYSRPTVIIVNYDKVTPRRNKLGVMTSAIGDLFLTVARDGGFDAIYCDESHRIKSAGASASRYCYSLSKHIPIRRALTGTPMADKPLDVYGQYRFLDDTIYGTNFTEFKSEYTIQAEVPGQDAHCKMVVGYDNVAEFTEKFHSIAFVVRAEDVDSKLPKTQHITRHCILSSSAKKMYNKVENDFIAWLDEQDKSEGHTLIQNALVQMLRLHQITSGLLVYDKEVELTVFERFSKEIDTSKRKLLKDVLEDLETKEPVVIFYRYNHDLENIQKVCKRLGRSLAELNSKKKQWKDFQYGSGFDTIAVNIRSGGAGINLTRARYHIFYTVGLSNADYRQALKRGHRYDETYKHKRVTYIHLVVPGTMDEQIKDRLESKGNLVKSLIRGYKERAKR